MSALTKQVLVNTSDPGKKNLSKIQSIYSQAYVYNLLLHYAIPKKLASYILLIFIIMLLISIIVGNLSKIFPILLLPEIIRKDQENKMFYTNINNARIRNKK